MICDDVTIYEVAGDSVDVACDVGGYYPMPSVVLSSTDGLTQTPDTAIVQDANCFYEGRTNAVVRLPHENSTTSITCQTNEELCTVDVVRGLYRSPRMQCLYSCCVVTIFVYGKGALETTEYW